MESDCSCFQVLADDGSMECYAKTIAERFTKLTTTVNITIGGRTILMHPRLRISQEYSSEYGGIGCLTSKSVKSDVMRHWHTFQTLSKIPTGPGFGRIPDNWVGVSLAGHDEHN